MSLLAAALLLSAALPQMHAAQGGSTAGDTDIVAGRSDGNERMTVPVRIGADGPSYRFLLDTGAQNTVVSTALAQHLSLPESDGALLVGVAGRREVRTVRVDELALGKRSYYGLTAPVLDATNIGADGIVGLDSLQGQRVLIDFRRNLVAVDDALTGASDGFDIVVRARRKSGQLIMTDAMVGRVKVAVVVDTGADATIGNRALQQALGRHATLSQTTLSSVTGQELPADVGLVNELSVQGLSISNVLLAFADSPPFQHLGLDRRPAILLGMREMRLFNRVAIDFPARKIMFDLAR